ncbi:MAG: hypothetical protein JXN59_10455, partial [Anaerolineae bacterium]|nr:hypothetical protein [Anaerolineae bacterium]
MNTRIHRSGLFWAACLLVLFCAGCASNARFASIGSAWSSGLTITQARNIAPPALGTRQDGSLLVAWADGASVYTRLVGQDGRLSAPVTLVSGATPWDITLLPGENGEWHLLWRDFDAYDTPRLYSAHLDQEGQLLRGPLAVSPEGVGAFAAMPGDGGTAVIIWASPEPQPDLYGRALDAQGRPSATPPTLITRRAEHPALTRTASGMWIAAWLAWPDRATADSSSQVITLATSQAALPWEEQASIALDQLILSDFTTYVESFRLGLDHETGYVFVGLREAASQTASTSMRAFSLATLQLQGRASAVTFPLEAAAAPAIDTGFNTGAVYAVPAGSQGATASHPAPAAGHPAPAAAHPAPAAGQHRLLPVAFA